MLNFEKVKRQKRLPTHDELRKNENPVKEFF